MPAWWRRDLRLRPVASCHHHGAGRDGTRRRRRGECSGSRGGRRARRAFSRRARRVRRRRRPARAPGLPVAVLRLLPSCGGQCGHRRHAPPRDADRARRPQRSGSRRARCRLRLRAYGGSGVPGRVGASPRRAARLASLRAARTGRRATDRSACTPRGSPVPARGGARQARSPPLLLRSRARRAASCRGRGGLRQRWRVDVASGRSGDPFPSAGVESWPVGLPAPPADGDRPASPAATFVAGALGQRDDLRRRSGRLASMQERIRNLAFLSIVRSCKYSERHCRGARIRP